MGDIADWIVDNDPWINGWESEMEEDMSGPPRRFHRKKIVSCKWCGSLNVRWVHSGNGWRLYSGTEPHTCKEFQRRE